MKLKKIMTALLGLGMVISSVPAIFAAPVEQATGGCTGPNVLVNPTFEGDWYRQGGTVELSVPGGWAASFIDGDPIPGSAGKAARRPEIVVWNRWQASETDKALFIHGEKIVKMFKPWSPVKFALSQNVDKLVVGQTYEFSGWVYIDVVSKQMGEYKEGYGNIYNEAVGFRMGASKWGSGWLNEDQIRYTPFWNPGNTTDFNFKYHHFKYRFTATDPKQTVWAEFYSVYGFNSNGIFLDNFNLCAVNGPADAFAGGKIAQNAPGQDVTPVPGEMPQPTLVPASGSPAATSAPAQTGPVTYTVQPGDNLSRIGAQFGVSPFDIAAYNKLKDASAIYGGQVLIIPPWATKLNQAPAATAVPGATAAPTTPASKPATYTVQPGDYLYKIARLLGVDANELARVNNLTDPSKLYVGQVLIVP